MNEATPPAAPRPSILDCEDLQEELGVGRDAALDILRRIGRRVGKRYVCTRESLTRPLETNDSGDKK